MIPVKENVYIKNTTTWDNTEPNKTVPYDNQFGIDILMKTDSVNPCVILEPHLKKLSIGNWRDQGFNNYQIREFFKLSDAKLQIPIFKANSTLRDFLNR